MPPSPSWSCSSYRPAIRAVDEEGFLPVSIGFATLLTLTEELLKDGDRPDVSPQRFGPNGRQLAPTVLSKDGRVPREGQYTSNHRTWLGLTSAIVREERKTFRE